MATRNQLHVNQLLSNVSVQYKNSDYKWDKLFPQVSVKKDSDLYRVYERNFRMPESNRSPGGVAREFTFDVSNSSYVLEQHALKDYVPVDDAENYDMGGLEVDTTEILTDAIYRRVEKSVADLFVAANWSLGVSLAAAAAWSQNTTVSDPVPVFDTAATTIIANSGQTPNCALMPRNVFTAVKNHISVLDRVKYTSSELGENMVAALIGAQELHVATAVQDTAAEGAAASVSNFYGNIAWLGYKAGSPGLKQASAGYVFMKDMPRVRSWFDNERNAMAIEVEVKYQAKVIASLTGYFINGAV